MIIRLSKSTNNHPTQKSKTKIKTTQPHHFIIIKIYYNNTKKIAVKYYSSASKDKKIIFENRNFSISKKIKQLFQTYKKLENINGKI